MREQCGREGCCSCAAVKTNRVGPKDLDAAFAFLKRKGVRVMSEPLLVRAGDCAGVKVDYLRDPWGNQL